MRADPSDGNDRDGAMRLAIRLALSDPWTVSDAAAALRWNVPSERSRRIALARLGRPPIDARSRAIPRALAALRLSLAPSAARPDDAATSAAEPSPSDTLADHRDHAVRLLHRAGLCLATRAGGAEDEHLHQALSALGDIVNRLQHRGLRERSASVTDGSATDDPTASRPALTTPHGFDALVRQAWAELLAARLPEADALAELARGVRCHRLGHQGGAIA